MLYPEEFDSYRIKRFNAALRACSAQAEQINQDLIVASTDERKMWLAGRLNGIKTIQALLESD